MKLTSALVLCLVLAGCVWRGEDSVRFKFQTSGQSLDVVPVYDYVVQGLVLKPATPSDAKIHRDAQSNALVEWRRRGRINYHWRDRAGVPVSEESEYYEIEVLSGSTVVRTVRIPLGQAQPIQWAHIGDTASIVVASDGSGSVYKPSLINAEFGVLDSVQTINGSFALEYEVYDNVYFHPNEVRVSHVVAGGDEYLGAWERHSDTEVYPYPLPSGPFVSTAPGDRFSISYIDGVLLYHKKPTSSSSPPIYRVAKTMGNGPYRVTFSPHPNGLQGIRNPQLLRFDTPDWTYTADMQTADGLTPGNSIRLLIYQISAQTGRGIPLDFTG